MVPNQDPPAGWPRPRLTVGRVLSLVGCAVFAVVSGGLAVTGAAGGDVSQVVSFAGGALFLGLLAALGVSTLRRPEPSVQPPLAGVTDQGERGLAFSYSRGAYYGLSALFVVMALLMARFAVAYAIEGTPPGWALAALFGSLSISVGWILSVVLRLAPGAVVLTPTGIYHRGLAFEHFVPWYAVVDVEAVPAVSPFITVRALPVPETRERRHAGRFGPTAEGLPFMVIRTRWLGSHSAPAYLALKHYFLHPQERAGLAGAVKNPGGL